MIWLINKNKRELEETEEIIRIKDDYIEWLKKHNLSSKRMAFKYIHLNKASINLPTKIMCKENLITQSMNDKAVSTQNRPIEFLFSVFKCEYLRLLPTKERNLNKLIKFVCDWVEYYNYIRFQPCLGWKTPKEFG